MNLIMWSIQDVTRVSADVVRGKSTVYSKLKMAYAQLHFEALFSCEVRPGDRCNDQVETMAEKHQIHTLHISLSCALQSECILCHCFGGKPRCN